MLISIKAVFQKKDQENKIKHPRENQFLITPPTF
jgi:hypothetical protein